jgi:serine/threonine-protein kinase PpkA
MPTEVGAPSGKRTPTPAAPAARRGSRPEQLRALVLIGLMLGGIGIGFYVNERTQREQAEEAAKPPLLPFSVSRDRLRDGSQGPAMVALPGGCFQMGSPEEEDGRDDNERLHRVCVGDFRLAKYELTVGEFGRFVTATGYRTDAERDSGGYDGCFSFEQQDDDNLYWDWRSWASWRTPSPAQANQDRHPVACISWNDALAYIDWLNAETAGGYRLPTEAEWEYAARAGTQSARFWGNAADMACDYANVADQTKLPDGGWWKPRHDCTDGYPFAADIGRFNPNPWGLHDMLGNLWEWTCSGYYSDYGGDEHRCLGKDVGGVRALRGGSWLLAPRWVRAANRDGDEPWYRHVGLGLRLAQDLR